MADKDPPAALPPSQPSLFEGLHMSSPRTADEATPKLSNRRLSEAEAGDLPPAPLTSSSPSSPVQPLTAAPMTDKLLGLLETPSTKPRDYSRESSATSASLPDPECIEPEDTVVVDEPPPLDTPPEVIVVKEDTVDEEEDPPQEEEPAQRGSWFGGWFGGVPAPAPEPVVEPEPETAPVEEPEEDRKPAAVEAESEETDAKPAAVEEPAVAEAPRATKEPEAAPVTPEKAPPVASAPAGIEEEKEAPEQAPPSPPKKQMDPADQQHLDDAFYHDQKARRAKHRGLGEVSPATPVPHADVALRLLRKFAYKTRPKILTTYGGSKSRSILTFVFGAGKEDPTFVAYRELMNVLYADGEDRDMKDDSDRVVDAVMGESGDSMARAKLAMAGFVYLFSMWGHASSRFLDEKVKKSQEAFAELLAAIFDSAAELVAHGCLDGVVITMGEGPEAYSDRAVHMLAQSVMNSDLTIERNELAAMKFLLTTGCRVSPSGEALLRGSHLLQTIRILYHIYLTTESSPNKTTARAALQQLVTSVFTRVVQSDAEGRFHKTNDNFPSEDHRDAFLVLRSICKLSMRSLPDPKTGRHSHVGLQSSGSNDTWEGKLDLPKMGSERGEKLDEEEPQREHAHLIYTAAIHPALESKLLALELLLYVLQRTDFSGGFTNRCGPQFHVAIRNYLCVSLLKNCTSDDTRVVNLSLRIFVPLVRNFRTILKNEIEAFVTNVFFVILDSKNTPADHKSIVVKTFDEICSDPSTLAEIFLNYDCDLSAVDLFHRIVNTLSKVSRAGLQEPRTSGISFMGGQSAARMEKFRNENRELRLDAMRALRQVLASLHASIVEPMKKSDVAAQLSAIHDLETGETKSYDSADEADSNGKQSLVAIYDSKKKRRAEESEAILRFNQKPSAGIAYASKCGHIDGSSPSDVARYLWKNKDVLEKTQIGEYLGREAEYQGGFSLKVLHEYVRLMDFGGLEFDEAIRYFLSGFRLPGEAQKIDRIMEKFAERFTEQNIDVFPTADAAFILAFSIIMLNTDLHNPAIKEERRMTKDGFIRNNRGICDGQDLPEELLISIFGRIKHNPISLKEDDEARERVGDGKASSTGVPAALNPASFFSSHYDEMDRARETNFQKERDHIIRTTESLLKRRRHGHEGHTKQTPQKPRSNSVTSRSPRQSKFVRTEDSGLRDEYVSPMFEVAWGPSLAAFSTAMESANGTIGALISIASDEELEMAAENAAETIEVCLTGFRFAICTAGLCGNETARDAYMLALSRFTQLGTGVLLEPRHVRCIQTMMSLAREDGELLGSSWGHVFRALSEINRFHQLFHLMARNDRAAAAAAQRRQRKLEEREKRRREKERRRALAEDGESVSGADDDDYTSEADDSLAESDLFSDDDDFALEEDMDAKAIDEANARLVYDAVSESIIEAIYERSSSFSAQGVKEFVTQLCLVSRAEISVRGDKQKDLTAVPYRQQHALLNNQSNGSIGTGGDQFHHSQPNIYNLQKLVEVTHYNMETRPRLIFAELWAIVADHLTSTALHSNPAIAMYAVDSFRQLSIQYLQRDELEVFEFQRRFLKPLESVMGRSVQTSTKELLLNCVDRIIHVYRSDEGTTRKGGLKSGWVPILTILGLGGRDGDAGISRMSFDILKGEIRLCLTNADHPGVLLSEHFVETVNALLMFVGGAHEEVSLVAIDQLALLASYLADDKTPTPVLKRKTLPVSTAVGEADANQDLELWWPILLGLSQSVGDNRLDVRAKGLETLFRIISDHFFSAVGDVSQSIQTLQLVFRGVLYPIIEFAEFGSPEDSTPPLPSDFERFLGASKNAIPKAEEAVEESVSTGWLETTFDQFMDASITLCLRSIELFGSDELIDEVFASLNACLLSDSGMLAIRGLQRLEQFVTSDLPSSSLTDDVWATVSHMLRRCLSARGLPRAPSSDFSQSNGAEAAGGDEQEEYAQAVQEFIAEDKMMPGRRYVGSNATLVMGLLLSSDRFDIGIRWRVFLIAGLGRGIVDWEEAEAIIAKQRQPKKRADDLVILPPAYAETAMYARKWMNRLLLQLISIEGVAQAAPDADPKTDRFSAGQKLVMDEVQRLLVAYLKSEAAAAEYYHTETDEALYSRFTAIVSELLAGLGTIDDEHMTDMAWISPVLLGSCIQSKNADIRLTVQKLVQRTAPAQQPYPTPVKSKSEADGTNQGETPADVPPRQQASIDSDDFGPIYLTENSSDAESNKGSTDDDAIASQPLEEVTAPETMPAGMAAEAAPETLQLAADSSEVEEIEASPEVLSDETQDEEAEPENNQAAIVLD